jgi:hypothetical protein
VRKALDAKPATSGTADLVRAGLAALQKR